VNAKKRKAPMKLTEAITPTGHPQSTYVANDNSIIRELQAWVLLFSKNVTGG
jgi:hypothetical protein